MLAAPYRDASSEIAGVVASFTDISRFHHLAVALRESEQRFRLLSDASDEGVFVHEDGVILDANAAMARIIGCPVSDLVGRHLNEFLPPESREIVMRNIRTRYDQPYEVVCYRADGSSFLTQFIGKSLSGEGRPIRVATMIDLTERFADREAKRISEERFRRYFELGTPGMGIIDPEGRWLKANHRLGEELGVEPSLLIGRPMAERIHPEDLAAWEEQMARMRSGEIETLQTEQRWIHSSGREVLTRMAGRVISHPAENTFEIVLSVADLTDILHAEQMLRSQCELAVALSAVQGLGRALRLAVRTALEVSSMTAGAFYFIDELSGSLNLAYSEGLSPKQAARLAQFSPTSPLAQAVREGKPSFAYDVLGDGWEPEIDPVGFRVSAIVPFSDDNGEGGCLVLGSPEGRAVPEYAQGTLEAIAVQTGLTSARLKAEEMALEARQSLLELEVREKNSVATELAHIREQLVRQTQLATIGQLTGSIAHELRNPLGIIRNAAFLLNRKLPESDCTQYLKIIEKEISGADRIITELMAMTRGESPKKSVADLRQLFDATREKVEPCPGIAWYYEADEEPFTILVDPSQAEQVLHNLFSNAVQAQEGTGWIRLTGQREGAYDFVTVSDHGPGIPERLLQEIFEPLFTTKAKGTGLGLAICRQIAERHGGTLKAIPSPEGAVFQWRLPHTDDFAPGTVKSQ